MSRTPEELMRLALDVATSGPSLDLPIGAIIFDSSGQIIASSRNAIMERGQIIAHAELLAIGRVDLELLRSKGEDMSIVVTLEPCPMCAWAIRAARFGRLIFGAYNPRFGAAGSVYDLLRDNSHGGPPVEVIGGVLSEECQRVLGDAFTGLRNNRKR